MKRALRKSSVEEFMQANCDEWAKQLVGELVSLGYTSKRSTLESYQQTLQLLQNSLRSTQEKRNTLNKWWLFFEFQLPRRQKRLDLIILLHDKIVVVEFKTGHGLVEKSAEHQVEDYSLDLRDFHETSLNRAIIPVVVGNSKSSNVLSVEFENGSNIANTIKADFKQLSSLLEIIDDFKPEIAGLKLDPEIWENGSYNPVPPILEAALHLYKNHRVEDIAACSAGSDNLTRTVNAIRKVIVTAFSHKQRTICFVTGVPGSGKTLAGLSAVHDHSKEGKDLPPSTFLSGNIPLVKVLREALIRDAVKNNAQSRDEAKRHVHTFVESMQAFVTEYVLNDKEKAPINKVIVFDEAQRAWDSKQMQRHKDIPYSEPEALLEVMGRHEDAVIIALVGNGQEIHNGEAGLKGWGDALLNDHRWKIFAAPEVIHGSGAIGSTRLFDDQVPQGVSLTGLEDLHLNVSRRTFKSRIWNEWVESFLKLDLVAAKSISQNIQGFDVRVTRDLVEAKDWLAQRNKGSRRCGIVSSSGNLRSRAFGIEIASGFRSQINWAAWFLNEATDVRSSSYLEISATEFECQGLELDETLLCWGGDFLPEKFGDSWKVLSFKGSKWTNVKTAEMQRFILSKYRVLLTRARSAMVIWVPPALSSDPTIDDEGFNLLYKKLVEAGIAPIKLT